MRREHKSLARPQVQDSRETQKTGRYLRYYLASFHIHQTKDKLVVARFPITCVRTVVLPSSPGTALPVFTLRGDTQLLDFALDRLKSLGSSREKDELSLRELVQVFNRLRLMKTN